jgi:hypothetical protein
MAACTFQRWPCAGILCLFHEDDVARLKGYSNSHDIFFLTLMQVTSWLPMCQQGQRALALSTALMQTIEMFDVPLTYTVVVELNGMLEPPAARNRSKSVSSGHGTPLMLQLNTRWPPAVQ